MFRLAEQVGGADLAIDRVVGDHQRLGWPGEQVDADAAEQLPLGFGDVGVAGPDDHVDRGDRLGADRHGGNGLHAAQHVNLVRAAHVHRCHDGRMCAALERGRTGDDAWAAGDAGRQHGHVRRRHHRVSAARHVAADGLDRDILVPEHDAWPGLDLQIGQAGLLRFGEFAHLRLGKADVFQVARRYFRDRLVDLRLRQPEALRFPLVELGRQGADRAVPIAFDLFEDAFDRLAHGVARLAQFGGASAMLEDLGQEISYLIASGLIGEPVPPVKFSGGPLNMNS